MSEKRASLEVIAPSVEEAVAKGLADLGLAEESVDVEVLDPGSRGLFGLGSRQARIRLTIKSSSPADTASLQSKPVPIELAQSDISETPPLQSAPHAVDSTSSEVLENASETEAEVDFDAYEGAEEEEYFEQGRSIEDDITLHVARETVIELFSIVT